MIMWILFLLVAYIPVVLVHELGHLVAAAWRGARGFVIAYGADSDRRVALPLPLVPIHVHLGWGTWTVPVRVRSARQPRWRPWEQILCSAAGPLAALALFWLLGGSLRTGLPLFLQLSYPVYSVQTPLQFLALLSFVAPLVPMHYRSLGADSDGLKIVRAIGAMIRRDQFSP